MCAAIDKKTTGIQKIFKNIFSCPKSSPLHRSSSNPDEIENSLQTDAIVITQPNRKSSLLLQPIQTERNASLPMDLMRPQNLALSNQYVNEGGGNVNNAIHINGSQNIHFGNNLQYISQVTKSSPENTCQPNSSLENATNLDKPRRFSGERRKIIEKLKVCSMEVNEEIITLASENISPKNAHFIYRYLGMKDATIEMIEKDNFTLHGSQEVTYKMLLHWKQSAENPTIGLLVRALCKNRFNECIAELIKHFTEDETLSELLKDQ